jgi:dihydrofolate reductase
VVGSKTYALGLSFKEWPYPEKKCFVFTSRAMTSDRNDVEFIFADIRAGLAKIEAQGFKRIWLVGGGALTRSFLTEASVDEYIVSIIPVLLGEGIPLFPPPSPEKKLRLVGANHYGSGLVQVRYEKDVLSVEK